LPLQQQQQQQGVLAAQALLAALPGMLAAAGVALPQPLPAALPAPSYTVEGFLELLRGLA
jgi:hypothetical protein